MGVCIGAYLPFELSEEWTKVGLGLLERGAGSFTLGGKNIISSERASQEEQNGANLSSVAPSTLE